jgi:hypothetical protein
LVSIFGLHELAKDTVPLFECGYYKSEHSVQVDEGIRFITKALRPQFISLLEAFDIPDSTLNSAIGNSYGDMNM